MLQNRRNSDFAPAKRGGRKALAGNLGKTHSAHELFALRMDMRTTQGAGEHYAQSQKEQSMSILSLI